MNTATHHRMAGLGAACGQSAATAHAVAGTTLSTAAGVLLMIPDPTMVTKIAAGVLAVGSAIQNFFFHPDCSKIATTAIVNQAEVFARQNLAAWNALPASQRTPITQQTALQNFDNIWAQVVQACTGPSAQYGSAGQACVADRQQGACHYQSGGQCWNWFVGYRDPIANDPNVAANAAAAASSPVAGAANVLAQITGINIDPNLLIGLALLGVGLVVFS